LCMRSWIKSFDGDGQCDRGVTTAFELPEIVPREGRPQFCGTLSSQPSLPLLLLNCLHICRSSDPARPPKPARCSASQRSARLAAGFHRHVRNAAHSSEIQQADGPPHPDCFIIIPRQRPCRMVGRVPRSRRRRPRPDAQGPLSWLVRKSAEPTSNSMIVYP